MLIIQDIEELKKYRTRQKASIAFVPTMGALHEGHLDLVREARKQAEQVWVNIYVNPLQFSANEDLDKYPKTFDADCDKLRALNVDLVFAPTVDNMANNVILAQANPSLANRLCGLTRAGHFDGVCSIVHTFFALIRPGFACFGEKDYQQLKVIEDMCANRNENWYKNLKIIPVPTHREADGLALSSRNQYLNTNQRQIAPKLYQELCKLQNEIPALMQNAADTCCSRDSGVDNYSDVQKLLERSKNNLSEVGFDPEYLEIHWGRILLAAKLGTTRLIDNVSLSS